jgi:23S rRNA (adenine2030-N6)-methyltransferase
VLLYLINRLKQKDKAFFVLDSHSGRGQYLLQSEQAQKTEEAQAGVFRLIVLKKLDPIITFYLKQVESINTKGSLVNYPGSPLLIAKQLRESDRLVCFETQKPECDALKQLLSHDKRVQIHHSDGYQGIKAQMPPKERRGLVFIDPPYEAQELEYQTILQCIQDTLLRWPNAQMAIWYPIKQASFLKPFMRKVASLNCQSALALELLVRPDNSPLRMNGSGMLLINPPYQTDVDILPSIKQLATLLNDGGASVRMNWLKKAD